MAELTLFKKSAWYLPVKTRPTNGAASALLETERTGHRSGFPALRTMYISLNLESTAGHLYSVDRKKHLSQRISYCRRQQELVSE